MILSRIWNRVKQHGRSLVTTCVLTTVTPKQNATIATLNSYEENAAAALCELKFREYESVFVLSPDLDVMRKNIDLAARALDVDIDMSKVQFIELNYKNLLRSYAKSTDTFVTHVLLPGRDLSGKRRHGHITHGSGMKRELAFKSPINVLHTTTEPFIKHQINEYHLRKNVEIVKHQPRLSISEHALRNPVRAREVLEWFETEKLALWVPTYRHANKKRKDQRVAGVQLSNHEDALFFNQIVAELINCGYKVILKNHSEDLDNYDLYRVTKISNQDLQAANILFYELLAVSALVITDYSSVYFEALQLDKPVVTWTPDAKEFEQSYRGFRDVSLLPQGLENPEFRETFMNNLQNSRLESK